MKARNLRTLLCRQEGGDSDRCELIVLLSSNSMWQMLIHEYHERLNTHAMVLEHRAVIEHSDAMIYTIEKW